MTDAIEQLFPWVYGILIITLPIVGLAIDCMRRDEDMPYLMIGLMVGLAWPLLLCIAPFVLFGYFFRWIGIKLGVKKAEPRDSDPAGWGWQ